MPQQDKEKTKAQAKYPLVAHQTVAPGASSSRKCIQ